MLRVLPTESLGHEDFHLLPEQFGACVPKQLLGLSVDELDPPSVVDDHHRVRREFDYAAKLILRRHDGAAGSQLDDRRREPGASIHLGNRTAPWVPIQRWRHIKTL